MKWKDNKQELVISNFNKLELLGPTGSLFHLLQSAGSLHSPFKMCWPNHPLWSFLKKMKDTENSLLHRLCILNTYIVWIWVRSVLQMIIKKIKIWCWKSAANIFLHMSYKLLLTTYIAVPPLPTLKQHLYEFSDLF